MFDIHSLLATLARKRPLFHSEADFQHALAWEIHQCRPASDVRLEYRPHGKEKIYIDVWVREPNGWVIALELKYKTRSATHDVDGESFLLLNQGAQDAARYDFVRDICRLEHLPTCYPQFTGIAVLLTNDATYWSAGRDTQTMDAAFRLHEGRTLCGSLAWDDAASPGTKKSPLTVAGKYQLNWRDYSPFGLRYTVVEITSASRPC